MYIIKQNELPKLVTEVNKDLFAISNISSKIKDEANNKYNPEIDSLKYIKLVFEHHSFVFTIKAQIEKKSSNSDFNETSNSKTSQIWNLHF